MKQNIVQESKNVIWRLKLDKDRLLHIPKAERVLFIALGHLANELAVLQKQVLWTSKFGNPDNLPTKGTITHAFICARLLAGKLKEGYRLLQKRFLSAKLEPVYAPTLSDEAAAALADLKRYFGRKNNIDTIRNQHAFHYSPEATEKALESTPDELEIFLGYEAGNTLYYLSEILTMRALIGSDESEPERVLSSILDDIVAVTGKLLVFIGAFVKAFFDRYPDLLVDGGRKEDPGQLVPLRSVGIPWFTDTSGEYAQQAEYRESVP